MTELTPLGLLFEDTRKKLVPSVSQNEVARRADISGTAYRNIIRGFAEHGGNRVPYNGTADTVTALARALGIASPQLREAGRPEAADALLDLEVREEHGHKTSAQLQSETDEIADDLREVLVRHGLDPTSRQMRILEPAIVGMAEMMLRFTEFTQGDDKGAESGHPKVDNDV